MAEMIPETLRGLAHVTRGEARLFRLLREKLPSSTVAWYNLAVRGRFADFILLDPERGLLVLEVKDWRLDQIRSISPRALVVATPRGETSFPHPLVQARGYALRIADVLAADPLLVNRDGPYRGRRVLPFGYGVVWTGIGEREFRGNAPELCDPLMRFRETLAPSLEPERFAEALWSLLPEQFPCSLTPEQVDRVRYHIFPEVRLPRVRSDPPRAVTTAEQPRLIASGDDSLAVMDLEQERLAKSIGDGHRLLRGVAGSGKTVTLVCRARLLAEANPHWHVLVLCYNVSLAAALRQMIERRGGPGSVKVETFHSLLARLARDAKLPREDMPDWADRASARLLEIVDEGRWRPPVFDAVLVDEAHDFRSSWLRLVVSCVSPRTRSLFVVHDSAQNIYRSGFSFKGVGIQIQGRAKVLRTNYRNTREIAELASSFLGRGVRFAEGEPPRDDEGQLLEVIRPQATRRSGTPPLFVRTENFREECAETAARVKRWIERGEYRPEEIAVLYVRRGRAMGDERYIRAVLGALEEAGVPFEWVARDRESKRSFDLSAPTVKVSTIHSAKGMDFAAVALVGVSMLPSSPEAADAERKLTYVGLTRARDTLLATYCKESAFVRDLLECAGGGRDDVTSRQGTIGPADG